MQTFNKKQVVTDIEEANELTPEEKLDYVADLFHHQIDEIVEQLKAENMIDEDQLPFNLLRRVILMTVSVYGYEDVNKAIGSYQHEARSCMYRIIH